MKYMDMIYLFGMIGTNIFDTTDTLWASKESDFYDWDISIYLMHYNSWLLQG